MNIAETVQEEDKQIVSITITTTLNQVFVVQEFSMTDDLLVVKSVNQETFINPDQVVSIKVLYK